MSDDRIETLLERWEECHERGEELSVVELCHDCPELIPAVSKCIRALRGFDGRFGTTATQDEATPQFQTSSFSPPGFEILGELGRGGMGVVYKARQPALNRLVALKVIRGSDLAGPEEVSRFRVEAQAVAQLRHPNIVQIHEIGAHDGRPFIAFEFVDGGSLSQRTAGVPQPPRDVAQMAAVLARAMQFAHDRGIVHRDLKPSNVLLSADGVPKVADFGLAKFVEGGTPREHRTGTGSVLGTPAYMAPEQAGGTHRVGPLTDVYALGAILYEQLVGRPPFAGADVVEILKQLVNAEPVAPRQLRPEVPRDLETICLKCLQKEPAKRYASASALAEDLERFLRLEPIRARPVGTGERVARWCRRNPRVAAALALAVAALLAVAGVSMAFAIHARRSARDLGEALDVAKRRLAETAYSRGVSLVEAGEYDHAMLWFARGLELAPAGATELRGKLLAELGMVQQRIHPLSAYVPQPARVDALSVSPKGDRCVTAAGGSVRLWDTATGQPIGASFALGTLTERAAFHPDGRLVALSGLDAMEKPVVVIWDSETGSMVGSPLAHDRLVKSLAWSQDGKLLATATWDMPLKSDGEPRVQVWDMADRTPRMPPLAVKGYAADLAFSRDGATLAVITSRIFHDQKGEIEFIDVATGKVRGRPGNLEWTGVAVRFTADEKSAWGVYSNRIGRWDVESGALAEMIQTPYGNINALDCGPNDLLLAAGNNLARLWSGRTGMPAGPPMRHAGLVRRAAFDLGGRIVTANDEGQQGALRVWAPPALTVLPFGEFVTSLTFSPDGRQLATTGRDGSARLWEVATGRAIGSPLRHEKSVWSAAFSPDGTTVVTVGFDGKVRRWSTDTGQAVGEPINHPPSVRHVSFRPDGGMFATAGNDGEARLWDARTGKSVSHCALGRWVERAEFSSDGRFLLAFNSWTMRLWHVDTGKFSGGPPSTTLPATFSGAAFHPDGRSAYAIKTTGEMFRWDAETRETTPFPARHRSGTNRLAVSPDGRWLFTAGDDRLLRIWDATTGEVRGEPLPHDAPVWSVQPSPDGRFVATTAGYKLHLWDVETGQGMCQPLQHAESVNAIAFSPDSRVLAAATRDGSVRLWRIAAAPSDEPERVRIWTEVLTGCALDEGGTLRELSAPQWEESRAKLSELGGSPVR